MNPIYFPYTHVSRPVLDRLNFFFRKITVYQPSAMAIPDDLKALEDKGLINMQFPVKGSEKKIAALLKEYNTWAGMHHGRNMAFFKTQEKWPPFFTETSTAQIKKEIINNADPMIPDNSALNNGEMIFNARVFLLIAQQMDHQNSQLITCLETADTMASNLFKQLKGEGNPQGFDSVQDSWTSKDSFRDYMIPERMHAFGCLVQQDEKISGVYVTDNRKAMAYLLEKSPHMKMISITDELWPSENTKEAHTSWQERFERHLEMLATASASVSENPVADPFGEKTADPKTGLIVYLIPDQSPRTVFTECTGIAPTASVSGHNNSFKNTLICFVND